MRTALVVEDDPGFEGVLLDSVRHLGPEWGFESFRLARSAINYVELRKPTLDMALVDLGLPDGSGTDVIRQIRRHSRDVPILVVSVLAAEAAVLDAIKAGANGYVLKDDNALSIGSALKQVMAGIYPISPSLARYLFKLAQGPAPALLDSKLSEKELEVLRNISRGHSYANVAKIMGISLSTVQTHIRNLYRKLGANSGVQAVTKAKESGFL